MLVDDEAELLDIVREHFAGQYEIDTAMSGQAALERFAQERPDAVFLDVNMPGMSGVDVLKQLRRTDPGVPVIMVTANVEIGTAEACLEGGAFGYVPKPFDFKYMDHIAAIAVAQPRARR